MGFDFHAIRELRGLHKALHCEDDAGVLPMRQRILDTIASLGVDVSAAPAPPADLAASAPHTLVLWATDEHMSVSAHVIPDAKISPELRDALAKTPFCFAGAADCGPGQWSAAVRVLAALDIVGMKPDEFYDAYVAEDEDDGLPTREEIAATYGACADAACVDLSTDRVTLAWVNHRFSVAYAFNLAM